MVLTPPFRRCKLGCLKGFFAFLGGVDKPLRMEPNKSAGLTAAESFSLQRFQRTLKWITCHLFHALLFSRQVNEICSGQGMPWFLRSFPSVSLPKKVFTFLGLGFFSRENQQLPWFMRSNLLLFGCGSKPTSGTFLGMRRPSQGSLI